MISWKNIHVIRRNEISGKTDTEFFLVTNTMKLYCNITIFPEQMIFYSKIP